MNMQCFIAFCIACIALVAGLGDNSDDTYSQFAPTNNAFYRYLRSSNGKPTFIRFGKRAKPTFIRFGRSVPTYSNFENQEQDA
ncbi:unnamed protein product [Cylicocyclus nassatus]|uniref:Uncharacterized protein n=1 Tax=Cylicocyclus nassatus TaxID=53992 RepID=A0AA36H851_CYLNA|nr:unnamed protein product [Cylicocyclus nassatus]